MRNIDAAFHDALVSGRDKGIIPRRFVYITAKDRSTGAPASIGIWNGDEDITITVTSAVTGLPSSRSYYGAMNIEMGGITRTANLTVQNVELQMSQIADIAQEIVRGYDVRLAKVEIHEILFSTETRQPVSTPFPVFLGEVDTAPIETPAIGQDGNITLNIVSDAISMLTRSNPKKSSYEAQLRRGGDEWGKYASTVGTWKVPWGSK